jgi:hypothetical protein
LAYLFQNLQNLSGSGLPGKFLNLLIPFADQLLAQLSLADEPYQPGGNLLRIVGIN